MKGGFFMKTVEDVKFVDLKKACKSANASGLLGSNIRHNGMKAVVVFNDFITAIEGLDDDVKIKLPDDVVDFYNSVVEDERTEEEDLNGLKPLDFDGDALYEPLEDPPDPIEDELNPVDESEEEGDSIVVEAPTEVILGEEEPIAKKTGRLSKTMMKPKINGINLIINFKDLNIVEVFKLPKAGDKEGLKVVRKKAFDFALENGATKGQLCHISKELNIAGFYVR